MFLRHIKPGYLTRNRFHLQTRNYSLWGRFSNLWNKHLEIDNKTPVMQMRIAFDEHQPKWFNQEQRNRQKEQIRTTLLSLDREKFLALLKQADENLDRWSRKKRSSPMQVEVIEGDWGDVAMQLTITYGETYGILNMANAYIFGGGFLDGCSAQEENMYERTTCSNHVIEEAEHLYLDEHNTYLYKMEMSDLINAYTPMTADELAQLSKIRGTIIQQAYKIHIDTKEPEICFRGPELYYEPSGNSFFDDKPSRRIALSAEDGSFAFLPQHLIYRFHEVRGAALDLTDPRLNVDWDNPEFLKWYRLEMKRRIDAQLDTALLHGITRLVLGPFGCGEFKNKPEEVSSIYKESIMERAEHFEHIAFYDRSKNSLNYYNFNKELHGIALGDNAKAMRNNRMKFEE